MFTEPSDPGPEKVDAFLDILYKNKKEECGEKKTAYKKSPDNKKTSIKQGNTFNKWYCFFGLGFGVLCIVSYFWFKR